MKPLVFNANSSHLYPGATICVDNRGRKLLQSHGERSCIVVFADGSSAPGTLDHRMSALGLAVQAHVTARGAKIKAKYWSVEEEAPRMLRIKGPAARG